MRKNALLMNLIVIVIVIIISACAPQAEPYQAPERDPMLVPPDEIVLVDGFELTNRVTEEWKRSGKMFTLTGPAQRESCAVACHDGYAFSTGEFARQHIVSIDCQACHSDRALEYLRNGTVDVPFTDEPLEAGMGALCITCHHGRTDARAKYEIFANGGGVRLTAPHHGPAALTTGLGGMEYPNVTYGHSIAHENLQDTCISCHMPETLEGYALHTFVLDDAYAPIICGNCHAGITDFNLNGFQNQVLEWVSQLEDAIFEETGAIALSEGGGQLLLFTDEERRQRVNPRDVSLEVYVAAYNAYLVRSDGSLGVHNPQYTKSLLQESYRALTGEDLR
ncbi:hypothetical protein [Desulfuribacillus alkaliarsenatis]|uniref:Uncharacterized protein n=1 Tax=Desulfuribacillus alkaliarsenatis TaxID=766136 RepID=A0A1E5G533_9FIRM|nr:hypothetical protein [Desulfuribacillus alkaliarsenatis]OEF98292.1 hypothetical protein BHF68_01020 [Desulfuribacillus alkaliarsenatis]